MNQLATINRPTRAPTLSNACADYIESRFRGMAKGTMLRAKQVLDLFEVFAARRTIDRQLLLDWDTYQSRTRECQDSTINKNAEILRCFFRWCGENGYMKDPPINLVIKRRVPVKPLPAIFTNDEYERIKEATKGTHNYFMTVISRNTGLSAVDVCHLRWSHIDMENLTIETNRIKTAFRNVERCRIPFLANSDIHLLLKDLHERRVIQYGNENDDWVNPELRGRYQYSYFQVRMSYGLMLKKLGIKGKSFKNWRNTFISMLANSGINHALCMKITGHNNVKIFADYVKPDWDSLRNGVQKAFQWAEDKETVKALRKLNNQ